MKNYLYGNGFEWDYHSSGNIGFGNGIGYAGAMNDEYDDGCGYGAGNSTSFGNMFGNGYGYGYAIREGYKKKHLNKPAHCQMSKR